MTGIETALIIAGTVASVASSAMGMIGQRQAANFQAQVAARNAQLERDNAVREIQRSQVEQQEQDLVARAMLGEQLAEQSASGLSVNESRSFDLARKGLQQTARLDALNIRQEGELGKYNSLIRAMEFDTERSAALARKRNATIGGALDITSSLIGGASAYSKAGGFSATPGVRTAGPRSYTRKI